MIEKTCNNTKSTFEINSNENYLFFSLDEKKNNKLNTENQMFINACQEGNFEIVYDLVSNHKVNVNNSSNDTVTGLHWACINNRFLIVKFLIENEYQRADPNILGGKLMASPLHWACRNGLVYIVDYLLSNSDADPRIKDFQSYNALHLAVHSSNVILIYYILFTCCLPGSKNYISVDEVDSLNCTSLHWACYQGDIVTVNMLLKFGADVNKIDNKRFIPLHWAFIKGQKEVLKKLLNGGSDIFAVNNQNKNSFQIAKDMDCINIWIDILKKGGYDKNNMWKKKKKSLFGIKTAKLITFFTSFITIPILFRILSLNNGHFFLKLLFAFLFSYVSLIPIMKYIIPIYVNEENSLIKSTYFSGLFLGSVFSCIVVWCFEFLPKLIFIHFKTNLLFFLLTLFFVFAFFKTMFMDPGFLFSSTDNSVILKNIKDLIELGKFDTNHFCVHSYIRKPLRSKYSRLNNFLVAKFDHYCPWVYNEIGVRNHKVFITYVYFLSFSIVLFVYLFIQYSKLLLSEDSFLDLKENTILPDFLYYAFKKKNFIFNLVFWCIIQLIWIFVLAFVQSLQIMNGVTGWEFNLLTTKYKTKDINYSTLPLDFPIQKNCESISSTYQYKNNRHQLLFFLNFLGLIKILCVFRFFIKKIDSMLHFSRYISFDLDFDSKIFEVPTDYGVIKNCIDFWFSGEIKLKNLFQLPVQGESSLNGKLVNYYNLYEFPPKKKKSCIV